MVEQDSQADVADDDFVDKRRGWLHGRNKLVQYVRLMHNFIPKKVRIAWQDNLRSMVQRLLGNRSFISTGDGCSGSSIWMHAMIAFGFYWNQEYGVDVAEFKHVLASESDADKRQILLDQHEIQMLSADVEEFQGYHVTDVRTGERHMLPEAVLFGAGTSCKDLSKTNNQRTVGALRSKKGTSGRTFDCVKQYVVKTRPTITFMENVPLIGQEYDVDGLKTSDKEYVIQSFEEEGFTVVFTEMHARERGAAKELIRAWFVIFNIPREVADSIGLEQMFFEVLNSLKTEPTSMRGILPHG